MLLHYYSRNNATSELWTPTNALIWYDFSDASVTTIGGNGGYAGLDDKGSASWDITSTALSEQAARGTYNSLYRAVFDGSNDRIYNGIGFDYDYSDCCFAIFMKPGTVTGDTQSVISINGSTNDWQLEANNASEWHPRLNTTFGAVNFSTNNETDWQILAADFDTTAGEINTYFNGTYVTQITNYTGFDATSLFMRIGVNRGANNFLNCEVAEVVFAPLADREKLEGYIAWKWSRTDLLPSGHPYKNAAPTT